MPQFNERSRVKQKAANGMLIHSSRSMWATNTAFNTEYNILNILLAWCDQRKIDLQSSELI